jgi:hypothetical protein
LRSHLQLRTLCRSTNASHLRAHARKHNTTYVRSLRHGAVHGAPFKSHVPAHGDWSVLWPARHVGTLPHLWAVKEKEMTRQNQRVIGSSDVRLTAHTHTAEYVHQHHGSKRASPRALSRSVANASKGPRPNGMRHCGPPRKEKQAVNTARTTSPTGDSDGHLLAVHGWGWGGQHAARGRRGQHGPHGPELHTRGWGCMEQRGTQHMSKGKRHAHTSGQGTGWTAWGGGGGMRCARRPTYAPGQIASPCSRCGF